MEKVKNHSKINIPHQQKGAVLIIAMIMLLILTILGVSVMESSVIEEKMAGNSLDRNVAFQAAEAGLRAGENWVSSLGNRPTPQSTAGPDQVHLMENNAVPAALGTGNWWADSTDLWWATNGMVFAFDGNVSINPRYMVEEYDTVCDGVVDPSEKNCKIIYRITAMAWGANQNSTVMLQSLFSRRY